MKNLALILSFLFSITVNAGLSAPGASPYWLTPAISAGNTPPGSVTVGQTFVVLASPTGPWAGNANSIATATGMGSPTSGPVVWGHLNGITAVGNVASFVSGSFSANGAITSQTLQNNGDYYQFTLNASAVGANLTIGVTHVPFSSGNGPGQTDIGANFSSDGKIYSFESDANYTVIANSWSPSDVFRWQVNSGSLAFYQNNVLIATDGVTPTFPVYGAISASIGSPGPTVTETYYNAGTATYSFATPLAGASINAMANGIYRFVSGAWTNP